MSKTRLPKTGEKVKIITRKPGTQSSGHGIPVGTEVEVVTNPGPAPYYGFIVRTPGGMQYTIYAGEYSMSPRTKEQLQKEISEKRSEIKDLSDMIDFLEESGSKEYDEDEFKVFQTLKTLEKPGLSAYEKAREIAKLIKQ